MISPATPNNGNNGHESPAPPPSAVAGLLEDPHHVRGDARLIAGMLSLGVVDEATVRTLLGRAFALAETSATTGNVRHYVSLMHMLMTAAKLEIDAAPPPTQRHEISGSLEFTAGKRQHLIDLIMERVKRREEAQCPPQ